MAGAPQALDTLLDELAEAAKDSGRKTSVGEVMDEIGRRSFGPLLLVTGLLGMTRWRRFRRRPASSR